MADLPGPDPIGMPVLHPHPPSPAPMRSEHPIAGRNDECGVRAQLASGYRHVRDRRQPTKVKG